MKKIILEIGALLAFIVVIFLLLEFLFRNYKNDVDRIMEKFSEQKNTAEILFVGNSHSLPLYECLALQDSSHAACLTIGGDDLFWMQALVKRQLKTMPKVKYVILNCDDELLGFNQTFSGLAYMNRMLFPYTDTMYGNKKSDILLSKSNFFRSNRDLGYLFNRSWNKNKMIAMASGAGHFTDEECKVRAIEISEKRFQRKVFAENLECIKSVIAECAQRKIMLFILKMPKCDCLEATEKTENVQSSRRLTDSLFEVTRTPVLDFTADSMFHRNDFANPDHLTTQAACRLAGLINEKIFSSVGTRPLQLQ